MSNIHFVVYGEPMAKQRPRASSFGKRVRIYTPEETIRYENKVLSCYLDEIKNRNLDTTKPLFDRASMISVEINAFFGLSKGDYGKKGLNKSGREKISNRYCASKKDIDNIVKIVLDGLNNVAYYDDVQIVNISATKYWTETEPRVEVTIREFYHSQYSGWGVDIMR